MADPQEDNSRPLRVMTNVLQGAERLIFAIVGVLLAAVALTLSFRSLQVVVALVIGPASASISLTAQFLDLVLPS